MIHWSRKTDGGDSQLLHVTLLLPCVLLLLLRYSSPLSLLTVKALLVASPSPLQLVLLPLWPLSSIPALVLSWVLRLTAPLLKLPQITAAVLPVFVPRDLTWRPEITREVLKRYDHLRAQNH